MENTFVSNGRQYLLSDVVFFLHSCEEGDLTSPCDSQSGYSIVEEVHSLLAVESPNQEDTQKFSDELQARLGDENWASILALCPSEEAE